MILVKSKSTQDFRNQRKTVVNQRESAIERVSFSSLLKNNMHQSEARYYQKSRQISESKASFPKKMLFSEVRNPVKRNSAKMGTEVDYISNERLSSEYDKENRNNTNNLFSNLLKNKQKSSLLEPKPSENLCTLSRQTADSQYWSHSVSQLSNPSQDRRQSLKYFKGREPVIREKSRRSRIEKETCNEYYYNHEKNHGQEDVQISFGDLNVNTSKHSIKFDMCPYL